MKVVVQCPAKVNTFLAVGPIDERRYHPIRTVFQAISLFDELELEVADSPSFVCDSSDVPSENTVTKALRLIGEFTALPPLRITLRKGIPSQSGLGGGSSDAAGLLRAVDALAPKSVPMEVKREVARAVGMDVPFFLVGGRARAVGYGEILEPLPDLPVRWLVIARPFEGVSTQGAYAALDTLTYPFLDFPNDPWTLYNDFERVAPCACGELAERLQILGASGAVLTGSGSAVFGLFDSQQDAEQAASQLPGSWVCRTLTRAESLL